MKQYLRNVTLWVRGCCNPMTNAQAQRRFCREENSNETN